MIMLYRTKDSSDLTLEIRDWRRFSNCVRLASRNLAWLSFFRRLFKVFQAVEIDIDAKNDKVAKNFSYMAVAVAAPRGLNM